MEQVGMKPRTVVVADSHAIVREGIVSRLSRIEGVEVVGEAADGYSAIKLCRQLAPDIALIDLGLSRPSGRDAIQKIKASSCGTRQIAMSEDSSAASVYFVLSQGVAGFLPKQARGDDIVSAVLAVASGYAFLPVDLVETLVASRRNTVRSGNVFGLSPREMEILEACLNGNSTKEVAASLKISVRTVETHRNSIYRKTSCKDLRDLTDILVGP